MSNLKIFFKAILIPVLVGVIVGLVTSNFMDYEMLNKPFLSPPGFLFPIVWTILYILMGVSYGILEVNFQVDSSINVAYYSQLFVNAFWPIIFFVLKWRFFAFVWIIVLVILVAKMIKEFYDKSKTSGLLQLPYLIWCIYATYLTLGTYLLNK